MDKTDMRNTSFINICMSRMQKANQENSRIDRRDRRASDIKQT